MSYVLDRASIGKGSQQRSLIHECGDFNHFLTKGIYTFIERGGDMEFKVESDRVRSDLAFGKLAISPSEKSGYRPYELFVSSLAGCSGSLLQTILQKKRQPYQRLEIKVSSVRNPDYANRIEQLSLTAFVHTKEAFTEQQAEKMADLVVKNCGMIQSIMQSIEVKFVVRMACLDSDRY